MSHSSSRGSTNGCIKLLLSRFFLICAAQHFVSHSIWGSLKPKPQAATWPYTHTPQTHSQLDCKHLNFRLKRISLSFYAAYVLLLAFLSDWKTKRKNFNFNLNLYSNLNLLMTCQPHWMQMTNEPESIFNCQWWLMVSPAAAARRCHAL